MYLTGLSNAWPYDLAAWLSMLLLLQNQSSCSRRHSRKLLLCCSAQDYHIRLKEGIVIVRAQLSHRIINHFSSYCILYHFPSISYRISYHISYHKIFLTFSIIKSPHYRSKDITQKLHNQELSFDNMDTTHKSQQVNIDLKVFSRCHHISYLTLSGSRLVRLQEFCLFTQVFSHCRHHSSSRHCQGWSH